MKVKLARLSGSVPLKRLSLKSLWRSSQHEEIKAKAAFYIAEFEVSPHGRFNRNRQQEQGRRRRQSYRTSNIRRVQLNR